MQRSLGISTSVTENSFSHPIAAEAAARGITRLELSMSPGSEWYHDDEAAMEAARNAAEHGIKIWSVHAPAGTDIDLASPDSGLRDCSIKTLMRCLELSARLKAGIMVYHGGIAGNGDEPEARLENSIRASIRLSKRGAEIGVLPAIEYLAANKDRICNSSAKILDYLDAVGGGLGVCLDTNHANLVETLPEAIRVLQDHIVSLHISDNDGAAERHLVPGEGIIDWSRFIRDLDRIGYSGPLMYESSRSGETVRERLDLIVKSARGLLGWEPANSAGRHQPQRFPASG